MKKFFIISTIIILSACEERAQKDSAPQKDSTVNMRKDSLIPPIADSSSGITIATLKRDTAELRRNNKKLEREKALLIKDTAQLGISNRKLISENKKLSAEKSKIPAKSKGDDCSSIQKENTSLKKSVQSLTIKNAALEGENSKLTKQLNPQKQDDVKLKTRDSKKRGKTKKSLKEEYKDIFDAVNGRKN